MSSGRQAWTRALLPALAAVAAATAARGACTDGPAGAAPPAARTAAPAARTAAPEASGAPATAVPVGPGTARTAAKRIPRPKTAPLMRAVAAEAKAKASAKAKAKATAAVARDGVIGLFRLPPGAGEAWSGGWGLPRRADVVCGVPVVGVGTQLLEKAPYRHPPPRRGGAG